jgi:ankyrin repeat protein
MKHLLITTIAAVVLATTAFADPIHDAARTGDLAGVQAELDKGVEVDVKDIHVRPPLHHAVVWGGKEVVELLIDNGADVNAKVDVFGNTPLHLAASGGHEEIVELLIANGPDVNVKNKNGTTPLHNAVTKEIAELLIANGADVNAKDTWGQTPLYLAAEKGHKEVAELLIAAGTDVNVKGDGGWTALHKATGQGHKETVELLIVKGADVNAQLEDGFGRGTTPIEWAANDTIDLLRKHGGKTADELVLTPLSDRLDEVEATLGQLQHLIIGNDADGELDEPSIEKLQGVFVIRGKVGGKYEVQYHTGDNDWQVREVVTLQANRQLYIDSSSYDEKRFYRIKLVE